MPYTDAELQESIAKLIRTSIRREYGALGNRRTDLTFNDTKNAAAGVFILEANAPFYTIKLAADRLAELIVSEQELVGNFIQAVRLIGRRVRPVENLSPLSNAKVALDALASATSARSSAHGSIEDVPAYQRFNTNTQRFLDDTKEAITDGGDVVQTPAEARGQLAGFYSELVDAHAEVLRRVALLENAIEDFSGLELSSILSADILANARDTLAANIMALQGLTASERLGILRSVTLDVLAIRSTVAGFGSLSAPTQFLLIEGTGAPFADELHPATPATLQSDLYGPYTVVDSPGAGIDLDFALDGQVGVANSTRIQLLGSFVARLEGTIKGTYDIGNPNGAGLRTDEFVLGLKNWPAFGNTSLVLVDLPTNAAAESWEVAYEINLDILAGAPTMPLKAEPYANPLRWTGQVDIDATPIWGTTADLIALGGVANFDDLGVQVGDWVRVVDGTSSNYGVGARQGGIVFEVESLQTTTTPNDTLAVIVLPAVVVADEQGVSGSKTIEIGAGTMPIRLRIHDKSVEPAGDYRTTAVDQRVAIYMPNDTGIVGGDEVQFNSLTTLGFYPLMEARSRGTDARDLATYVTQNFAAAIAGTVRLSAEAVFSPTIYAGSARTDPFSFLKAVLYTFSGEASVSWDGISNTFTVAGDVTSQVSAGDVLVLRDGSPDPNEINSWGIILSASYGGTDTALNVVMSVPVDSTTGPVDIEVGPDLSAIPYDATLKIEDGSANTGDYEVLSVGDIPLELNLTTTLPFSVGAGNLPVQLTVQLGQYRVDFSSTSTLLDSAIAVDGTLPGESSSTARARFFNSVTNEAIGTTAYFELPEWPKAIEEGDVLELSTTQYNVPDYVRSIESLEQSSLLIQLADELPVDVPSFTFSTEKVLPFARIRKFQLNNYSELKANLSAYLLSSSSKPQFFTELQRLLNPLTATTNPTVFQVNDPVSKLTELETQLGTLSGYLELYQAKTVDQVESLIGAFLQKGSDRAVDLLLEANFSGFFGLEVDELSYASNLQKKIREVEKNDLPVRKTNRINQNVAQDVTLASYEEPDFEFDHSDAEEFEDVAIPVGSKGVPYPGSSFG